MKKVFAAITAFIMMLALNVTAFAAGREITLDQAKQAALDYAGVQEPEASFTKAARSLDDGREVFEFEFYTENTEFNVDVDVNTGRVMDFDTEFFGRGNQTVNSSYHARFRDWDDIFDFDFDYDYDDYDYDDIFDWD